jgi:hypothetical protein
MQEKVTQQDDYGFYCDLEAQDDDEIEYYVVTTSTHYEVRQKSKTSIKINGEQRTRTNIIKLESAKSSTDNLSQMRSKLGLRSRFDIEVAQHNTKNKSQNMCLCFPKDIFYSVCVCFTTCSCLYFIATFPQKI